MYLLFAILFHDHVLTILIITYWLCKSWKSFARDVTAWVDKPFLLYVTLGINIVNHDEMYKSLED